MWGIIHGTVTMLNESILFTGFISILINILSRIVTFNFSKTTEKLIKNSVTQEILFFLICIVSTKNIYIAIVLTILFFIFTQYLFNEKSQYYIFPIDEDFEDITEEEIKKAKYILRRAQLRRSEPIRSEPIQSEPIQSVSNSSILYSFL